MSPVLCEKLAPNVTRVFFEPFHSHPEWHFAKELIDSCQLWSTCPKKWTKNTLALVIVISVHPVKQATSWSHSHPRIPSVSNRPVKDHARRTLPEAVDKDFVVKWRVSWGFLYSSLSQRADCHCLLQAWNNWTFARSPRKRKTVNVDTTR